MQEFSGLYVYKLVSFEYTENDIQFFVMAFFRIIMFMFYDTLPLTIYTHPYIGECIFYVFVVCVNI